MLNCLSREKSCAASWDSFDFGKGVTALTVVEVELARHEEQ